MTKKYNMTIGGNTVVADDYVEVRNPANTDEVVGLAPVGGEKHVNEAISDAQDAFAKWRHSSDQERVEAVQTIAKVCEDNAEELAVLLTKEQGKPLNGNGSRFELGGCAGWAGYTSSIGLSDKVLEDSEESNIVMQRHPLGVVGSITPWNWPLMIAIWHIAPGVRTGNTVVIKPSPYTPLSTLRMVQLIAEALPPGVVNVVSGGDEVGAQLTDHDDINKIVFTGSLATGKKVMACAAKRVTPVTLELGGNDAGIVLPGTDVSQFVEGLFWGSMLNSGQTCGALKRLYVHDDQYDAACKAMVEMAQAIPMGDGMDENSILGPLQNKQQFDIVSSMVNDARDNGAKVLCGGDPQGGNNYFYPVTIVADAVDGMRLVDEEQFGTALPIIRYSDVDDAIAAANGLNYGLDASVWGHDKDQCAEVATQLEAGTVLINKHIGIAPHVPFGGIKGSGLGVEFGQEGLEAYTYIKVINAAA